MPIEIMELWLLLVLLSLFLYFYFMIERSLASITQTPAWILSLIIMAPLLVWAGWLLAGGARKPLPPGLTVLIIGLFFVCPLLCRWAIELGRRDSSNSQPETPPAGVEATAAAPTSEAPKLRPIDKAEEVNLRNCFPWSIFYLENIEYRPQAVLCRGKLRSNPDLAYKTILENIRECFGDRFFVIFQEGMNGKPFFALVPNPQAAAKTNGGDREVLFRPGLALGLLAVTVYTTTLSGLSAWILGKEAAANAIAAKAWGQGLPYAVALIAILGIHELGHYFTAGFYKIRTTLPYFIPLPFFPGTVGAFIQMRSPIPHRQALFDVSIAGPLAGLVAALPVLWWGLSQSTIVPLNDTSGMLNFTSLDPRFSFLLALLSKLALGSALTANSAIHLHPVAAAGYIGLIVTAFNLMPIGQLDGGRMVHAMFGQRNAATIGQIARVLMFAIAFVRREFLIWAILLVFLPGGDEPALNDISELDNLRDLFGLLVLLLLILIVLPLPAIIAQWWQI